MKRALKALLASVVLATAALPALPVQAASPDYNGYGYPYGTDNITVKGDLTKSGLDPDDNERPARALWHTSLFQNKIVGEAPKNSLNGEQFDLQPDFSKGDTEWRFSGKEGYYLVPKIQSVVQDIAQRANGNPTFVWQQVNNLEPPVKLYWVNGKEWIDFGSIVTLSGGGNPNQVRIAPTPPDSWEEEFFRTTWETTPWPKINTVTFNGTGVISNDTVTNNGYVLTAGNPLTVNVTGTAYGAYGTDASSKIYTDGSFCSGCTSSTSGGKTTTLSYSFTISSPTMLTLGQHTVSFQIVDRFARTSAKLDVTYNVVAAAGCDPSKSGTKATVTIGGSSQQMASMGEYTLPQGGGNTISLTFPKAGTLKVDGADVGTGTTFNNIRISGTTVLRYDSTDGTQCWLKDFHYTPPTGPECDPNSDSIKLDVDMLGGSTVNDLSSGGTYVLDKDVFELDFTAPKKGSFYVDGSTTPMKSGTTTFSLPVSYRTDVKVKYTSDDGMNCWTKYFTWDTGTGSCPKYYLYPGAQQLSNGESVTVPQYGSLDIRASYIDEEGTKKDAFLLWHITKPDGSTYEYRWTRDDKWESYTTERLLIPDLYFKMLQIGSNPRKFVDFVFDQVGTYTITTNQSEYDRWIDCSPWQITVVVKALDCSDVTVQALVNSSSFDDPVPFSGGSGTASDPYKLNLTAGQENYVEIHTYLNGGTNGISSDYTWKENGTEIDSDNVHVFTDTDIGTWLLVIESDLGDGHLTCTKYVQITIGEQEVDCFKVSFSAKVKGGTVAVTSTGSDTFSIRMQPGQTNDLSVTAMYDKATAGVTATWTLTGGSIGTRTVSGNPFTQTFTDSGNATYTLSVDVKVNGKTTCTKTITIQLSAITCSDLHIMFATDSDDWKGIPRGSKQTLTGSTADFGVIISDMPTMDDSRHDMRGTWTTSPNIPNDSPQPDTSFGGYGVEPGTYTITFTVDDPKYPMLQGCTLSFTVEIKAPVGGCNGVYLHMYDTYKGDFTLNIANGSTLVFPVDKVDEIDFALLDTPDRINGATPVYATWTGELPNGLPPDVQALGYQMINVGPGTYHIKGTVINRQALSVKLRTAAAAAGCTFSVTVIVGKNQPPPPCDTCNPGGGKDGGKMNIRIYDSDNRLLTGPSDGVWEREPARIEVTIDQSKIQAAFATINAEIAAAIERKKAELTARYPAPDYQEVVVTAVPSAWDAATNPQTDWPSSVRLAVNGPGGTQVFTLNPKNETQSHTYTGTTIPTQTTWRQRLQPGSYMVAVDPFQITVSYRVVFEVSYQACESKSPGIDPETGEPLPPVQVCSPGSDTDEISGMYTIDVQGDQTSFEVFEPNAKGGIAHTAEWQEYHARDRYPSSQPNDFYAGERILVRVQLEERHKHPVSGKFPRIVSATSWMYESGRQADVLSSTLPLQSAGGTLWTGPMHSVPKLGLRENGVDTPLMGDKQRGLKKDGQYAVYFAVQFGFGAQKGFLYPNKTVSTGHPEADYKVPLHIIANAWERQGIRNHTTH